VLRPLPAPARRVWRWPWRLRPLSGLRRPDALIRQADELADAAHAIAGSAGLLGFERLTAMGRRFSRAAHAGAAEAPSLADGLGVALEVTLQTLHDRTLIAADA